MVLGETAAAEHGSAELGATGPGVAGSATALPSLPPIIRAWERDLLAAPTKEQGPTELERFAALAAGPFHVLNPAQFRSNVRDFQRVGIDASVDLTIYFARKANKSECWLPVVAEEGHGVDVASGAEFIGALSGGVPAHKLVVTGAEKADSLLDLAIRHGSLLVVDSPAELLRVHTLAGKIAPGHSARVLLRLLPETQSYSRFGTSVAEWTKTLDALRQDETCGIDCTGVSFHLNGYSAQERGEQAHRALDFLAELRQRHWQANTLDIGGGLSIQYCDSQDWEKFSRTVFGDQTDAEIFHSDRRPQTTYPYGGQAANGPDMLAEVLRTQHPGADSAAGPTVADRLRTEHVRLAIEPGRALLDGCGFSVFPIQGVKERDGYAIATASGLSMSVSEQWKSSEFLPDMTLWPSEGGVEKRTDNLTTALCVGGSSCMEYDMLTWRKVPLHRKPRRGDLLIYHNTAGYQMDKNESEFHQMRLPMRFVYSDAATPPRIDRPHHEEMP